MSDDPSIRSDIVEACRSLNRLGLSKGTSGNISVRMADGFLVSPTGIAYDAMTPDHVVFMRWDGTFDGNVLPSSEWRLHRDLMLQRAELNAVVHTHSTYATTVSILGHDIPAIHYSIAAAGGNDIRCAEYATFGTEELAKSMLVAMKDRRACLLARHGVVTADVTLAQAMSLAATVEELAHQYLLVLPFGEPPVLPEDEIARVIEKFKTYGQQPASASQRPRQGS